MITDFEQLNNSLRWSRNHEIVQIEVWGQNSLRVRATQAGEIRNDLVSALLETPLTQPQIKIGVKFATIRNGAITAEISAEGHLRFIHSSSKTELLAEHIPHFSNPGFRTFKVMPGNEYRLEAHFQSYTGERLFGLGQHTHGQLDQKGCVIDLIQHNGEVSIPFVLSNRGYGFLWNNPAVGRVELGVNGTRWVAESTPQMDYWITAGSTPAEIIERYTEVVGRAPNLPEWAAGFWQSKLRYLTQEEVLNVAHEYKRRGLPLAVIVIDYFHWTLQGDWKFNRTDWPDPAAMVRELEQMGVKLMVSIFPTVNALSPNFEEMKRRGLLVRTARGVAAHTAFYDTKSKSRVYVHIYDATHPEARRFIWEKIREGYHRFGIKIWWLDACEPFAKPMDTDNLCFHLGNGQAVANIYPQMHARAFFEGMQAAGEEEIITLCRSAWAGSQRYGAAVWSGDVASTFESLQAQVRAGLNIALSGIPWWTTDIGGFYGGDPQTPYFRELIIRWFQYGVFCPLFRLHGARNPTQNAKSTRATGAPNEVWSFGDDSYEIIRELLLLRERLRPYIMVQMRLAHDKGVPPMRPLFFDFPLDKQSWAVDDQFMFGPDLLVAPVLFEGMHNRPVYLPAGPAWTNAWTDETFEGGQSILVDASLDTIPLFLRGDAKLPIKYLHNDEIQRL